MEANMDITKVLIDYVAHARSRQLPSHVVEKAKHHILDTFAAMISGSQLRPGQLALKYAALSNGGPKEAQVVASNMVLPAVHAALANGMLAHADETDDSGGG